MKPSFAFRPRARLDLLEQFLYLADQATVEVAERYFTAVNRTCARMAKQPLSGTPHDSGIARLAGMRRVPVSGFTTYSSSMCPRRRHRGCPHSPRRAGYRRPVYPRGSVTAHAPTFPIRPLSLPQSAMAPRRLRLLRAAAHPGIRETNLPRRRRNRTNGRRCCVTWSRRVPRSIG